MKNRQFIILIFSGMGAIIYKIWFLLVILPILIFQEGWAIFSKFLDKGNHRAELYKKWPYFLLAVLVLLLIILLLMGYR